MGRHTSRYVFPDHGVVSIPMLGRPGVVSALSCARSDSVARLVVDGEFAEEFDSPQELTLEKAGARRALYFDPAKVKAAVVTCGGLCPGINDVLRSLVRTLRLEYRAPSVLGIRHGLRGFIPGHHLDVRELDTGSVASINESGGTFLGTSRGPQPVEEILDALERLNVSMLFIIGGDGTLKAAQAIDAALRKADRRVAVVAIPKTIDNDINFIPRSFGFETAVDKTVEALRCARTEAMSVMGGIGVVKIMGRESGFIAAHAALAFRDVDFVLVPESPFSLHGDGGLLRALEVRLRANGNALIAVAEGAGRDLIPETNAKDASGNRKPGDIAGHIMREIAADFSARGIEHYFKYIDPSYIVRSVPAGTNDRIYAATLGQQAAHAAMSGRTGMVVAQIMDQFVHLPLALVTEKRRKLNLQSSLWRSVLACTGQRSLMTSEGKHPGKEETAGNKGRRNERIVCGVG